MSRLRISDPQSIRNLMLEPGASASRRVRQLDIEVHTRGSDEDRVHVELRDPDPAERTQPPGPGAAPDPGAAGDLAAPDAGPERETP